MDNIATIETTGTSNQRIVSEFVNQSLQEKARSSLHFMLNAVASYVKREASFDSVSNLEFEEEDLLAIRGSNEDLPLNWDPKLHFEYVNAEPPHTTATDSKPRSVNFQLDSGIDKGWTNGSRKRRVKHIRYLSVPSDDLMLMANRLGDENTPLLTNPKKRRSKSLFFGKDVQENMAGMVLTEAEKERLVRISAAFLMDYEASRPATLHGNIKELTDRHLLLRAFRFSRAWAFVTVMAAGLLFLAPYIEDYFTKMWNRYVVVVLFTFIPAFIFFVDIKISSYLRNPNRSPTSRHQPSRSATKVGPRGSQSHAAYLAVSLLLICAERVIHLVRGQQYIIIWSGILTPIALFYVFQEARDSFNAFRQVIPQIVGILAAQLSVELFFAAAARIFFGSHYSELFGNLQLSFINLYQLAITVVNPSLWLGIYKEHHSSALFFVTFQFVSNIYFHSLVLSVVFRAYLRALKHVRMERLIDREDALSLAFQTLCIFDTFKGSGTLCFVPSAVVKKVLKVARPHYSAAKIQYLFQTFIANPGEHSLNYETFRTRIPMALSISLQDKTSIMTKHILLKLYKLALSLANLIFVGMATIPKSEDQLLGEELVPVGTAITLLSLADMILSVILNYHPHWRPDFLFDASAVVAFLVSFTGILPWLYGMQLHQLSITLLLTGRVIDLMRFFRLFFRREIARRSKQAWRCATGPLVLLVAAMHCIVHVGIALWGNLITVGSTQGIEPFYDVQNFNSFASGMLTVFNIVIGNDWNAIVAVFLTISSPTIVYPFFMAARELSCILVNVLLAFFIEAIVSQEEENDVLKLRRSKAFQRESILEPSYEIVPRSSADVIMNKLLMEEEEVEDEIKKTCHAFNLFDSMASYNRKQVGFLLCCQTMVRFCNSLFKQVTREFISEEAMHVVVSEMHIDLIALGDKNDADSVITRNFPHPSNSMDQEGRGVLEIRASLLQADPPISLFMANRTMLSAETQPFNENKIEVTRKRSILENASVRI